MLTNISPLVRALLARGLSVDAEARGGSMLPMLLPGVKVRIAPCNAAEMRRGDIVVFVRGDAYVAHRVLRNTGSSLLCHGDGVAIADGYVPYANVVGRVVKARVAKRFMLSTCNFAARSYGAAVVMCQPWFGRIVSRCVGFALSAKRFILKH